MKMPDCYQNLLPHPSLREYVRFFLYMRFDLTRPGSVPMRACWPIPYGCLAFNAGDPTYLSHPLGGGAWVEPQIEIVGQQTETRNRWHGPDLFRFHAFFEPGALHRLTGIPQAELTDAPIDAETVFGPEVRWTLERIGAARCADEMVDAAEAFIRLLVGRSRVRPLALDRIAPMMARNDSTHSQDGLARAACLSPRQFYNRFVERIGIGPKAFRRIARLSQAMKCKFAQPDVSWTDLAPRLGYFDYQHMVKDFKRFALHTPGELLDLERLSKRRVVPFTGWKFW